MAVSDAGAAPRGGQRNNPRVMAWKKYATQPLEVIDVPVEGHHGAIMWEPNVQLLAADMVRHMAAAETQPQANGIASVNRG